MSIIETIYRYIGWVFINIDITLIALILIGATLLWLQKKKSGRRFVFIGTFGLVFLGITPVGVMMLEGLENRFPMVHQIPQDAKGMILLGGYADIMVSKARGETAYNLTAGKLIKFIEVARAYPHLKLIFTGNAFEAEAAKKNFQAFGIDPARVHFESNSTNTIGNSKNTLAYIDQNPGETWILVTSAYHLPRAVGLFRKGQTKIIPYPVDYHTPGTNEWFPFLGLKTDLAAWNAAVREWFDMFANYMAGRSDELYPSP
jgi:uncharacterized SAM-binding protein YcdF (DUF218 family)